MNYVSIAARLPILSAALFLAALVDVIRTLHLKRTGERTEGTVVELDRSNEGITPIVGFQARDGKDYRFRVRTILGKEHWEMGTKWPVVYRLDRPERALVDRFVQLWGAAILFAIMGTTSFIMLSLIHFLF
jgi:hypothetical protein